VLVCHCITLVVQAGPDAESWVFYFITADVLSAFFARASTDVIIIILIDL